MGTDTIKTFEKGDVIFYSGERSETKQPTWGVITAILDEDSDYGRKGVVTFWTDDCKSTYENLNLVPNDGYLYVGNILNESFEKDALVNSIKYGTPQPGQKEIESLKIMFTKHEDDEGDPDL